MKRQIKKIQEKGPEHVTRVARIFAGITTLIIVAVWIILSLVFNQQEEEPDVEVSNGPSIQEFIQEAETAMIQIGEDARAQNEAFRSGMEAFEEEVQNLEEEQQGTEEQE